MIRQDIADQLQVLVRDCLAADSLELVDLVYRQQGGRLGITVLADKSGGAITMQECAAACRRIKGLLEEKNIIQQDYILEVASPGLDRPLAKKEDFLRAKDKEAVFYLNDLIDGKCQWQGIIQDANQEIVFVRVNQGVIGIPLTKINKAQLVI